MLKAIIFHLKRILRGILSAPGRFARWLSGGGAPMVQSESFEEAVDEQISELREELDRTPVADDDELQTLGERIHEYASGDRDFRNTFDMTGMPDHVAIALCCMPPLPLIRLASAGPVVCGRWARGEKTGLVGVPFPRTDWADVRPQAQDEGEAACVPEGEEPSRERGWQLA